MLPPDVECRAWIGLAEIGMNIVDGGLEQKHKQTWMMNIEAEVSFIGSKLHLFETLYIDGSRNKQSGMNVLAFFNIALTCRRYPYSF